MKKGGITRSRSGRWGRETGYGKWATIALTISLFLLSLRRSGERAGRLVERFENTEKANEIQRKMLEATSRFPRNRSELAERLRDGEF
jgi:hypothetical protein